MNKYHITIVLLIAAVSYVNAELAVGDTIIISAGYSNFLGMSGGHTEATEVLDSITSHNDTTFYHFSVTHTRSGGFFEDGGTMSSLITATNTTLAILSAKPSCIQASSTRFDNIKWILSEKSSLLFYESIFPISFLFPIPIDESTEPYSEDDYYTVRYTDTTGMKWISYEYEGTQIRGQKINFNDALDSVGTIQSDSFHMAVCGDTPMLDPAITANTGSRPLNLLRFGLSSLDYPLVGSQMAMGSGCYSSQVIYHKPKKWVSVTAYKNTKQIPGLKGSPANIRRFSLNGKGLDLKNLNRNSLFLIVDKNGKISKHISI